MYTVYPTKISKELKEDETEIKVFIFWTMHAMEFCFSTDSDQGFDDIDIYKLSLDDLRMFYENLIQAFLIMFFTDYDYHSQLGATYYRIKSYTVGENFRDLNLYENFENKAKPHTIARDLCVLFSLKLDRGISFKETKWHIMECFIQSKKLT
jgi:hypothetical protein